MLSIKKTHGKTRINLVMKAIACQLDMQIDICTEYLDRLQQTLEHSIKLVCQEPGLKPTVSIPGHLTKQQGLDNMSSILHRP